MKRIIFYLVIISVLLVVGAAALLAVWDVPPPQTQTTEVDVPNDRLFPNP